MTKKFALLCCSASGVAGLIEKDIEIEGATYRVSLTYDSDAGIPDNAQLDVTPVEMTDEEAAAMMGYGEDDIVLYTKVLDISILADGVEIEPNEGSQVTVTVQLLDAVEGADIDVFHMAPAQVNPAVKSPLKASPAKAPAKAPASASLSPVPVESSQSADGSVTFTTDSFSYFGFSSVAKEVAKWSDTLLSGSVELVGSILAPSQSDKAESSPLDIGASLVRGLELLDARAVQGSTSLWLKLSMQKVADLTLGKRESIDLYSVVDGKLGELVREDIGLSELLQYSLTDWNAFALVKDSGMRNQTLLDELFGITVDGYVPKDAELEVEKKEKTELELEENATALVSYDITIVSGGEAYQPAEEQEENVQVSLPCPEAAQALSEGYGVELWHVKEDGTKEQVPFTLTGDSLTFEAGSFSEYTLVKTVLEKEISVEGDTYKITVAYDSESGLPTEEQGAKLDVEVKNAADYQAVAEAALGSENVSAVRAFDISIVDGEGVKHQPTKDVNVTIELIGEKQLYNPQVVHIPDGVTEADKTITPVQADSSNGIGLTFQTSSFSVYVVTEQDLVKRFVFLNTPADVEKTTAFASPTLYIFSEQGVKSGKQLVAPADPTREGWVFSHWEDASDNSWVVSANRATLAKKGVSPEEKYPAVSIDVDAVRTATYNTAQAGAYASADDVSLQDMQDYLNKSEQITYFYAVYEKNPTLVTFYNQSGMIFRTVKLGGEGNITSLDPNGDDKETYLYDPIQDKANTELEFVEWTEDPRAASNSTPAGTYSASNPDLPEAISLYPVLVDVQYLYFDSNKAPYGIQDASYVSPLRLVSNVTYNSVAAAGQGMADLINGTDTTQNTYHKDHGIPVADGYTFEGWYLTPSCEGEAIFKPGMVVDTNNDGAPDTMGLVYNTNSTDLGALLNTHYQLPNNPTLYAKWTPNTTADYTIIIWKQKITDKVTTADDDKDYDYETSYTLNGVTGTSVSVPASDTTRSYDGFQYNATKSDTSKTLTPDGNTVLNVYYDRQHVTINFYLYDYTYTISTNDNDNNPEKYGDVNGSKARVYWRSNAFRTSNSNNAPVYNGPVYIRSSNQTWHIDRTFTGLYNQTFEQAGLIWPMDHDWHEGGNNNGTVSGGRTTFLDGFIIPGGALTKNYYGKSATVSNNNVEFYKQDIDAETGRVATTYTVANSIPTVAGGGFTVTNKYAPGFKPVRYTNDDNPGGVTLPADPINTDGDYTGNTAYPNPNTTNLKIYFDRLGSTITFKKNDGTNDNVAVTSGVPFEAPLNKWFPATPTREGYAFTGWYYDEGAKAPVEADDTMPAANLILYAGWDKQYYHAVLYMNGGEFTTPQTEDFWLEHGERISLGANPTRDYLEMEAGAGEYSYTYNASANQHRYTKASSGDYDALPGAYVFDGWYELNETGYGVVAAQMTDGNIDRDDLSTTHLEQWFKDGTLNLNAHVESGAKFSFTAEPDNRDTFLVARWRRGGGFYVRYSIEDSTQSGLDYAGVDTPVDNNEYFSGANAVVRAALGAPKNGSLYVLDHWHNKNAATEAEGNYQPNELIPVDETTAKKEGHNMIVELEARYRAFNPDSDPALYTFIDTKDKSVWQVQRISAGEALVPPAEPSAPANHVFKGWFHDSEGLRPFEGFGTVEHPTYTTIYAVYEKIFTVTYYLSKKQAGTETWKPVKTILATQEYNGEVGQSEKLDTTGVVMPLENGYIVSGWVAGKWTGTGSSSTWSDTSTTTYAYNGYDGTAVTGNLQLRPVISKGTYLRFNTMGGKPAVPAQSILEGEKPIYPDVQMKRPGYYFDGWYTTPSTGGEKYTFQNELTKANYPNFDGSFLYARWISDGSVNAAVKVVWWVQTADRPDDASEDYTHYEVIATDEFQNIPNGTHTASEIQTLLGTSAYDILDIQAVLQHAISSNSDLTMDFSQRILGTRTPNAAQLADIDIFFGYTSEAETKTNARPVTVTEDGGTLNVYFDRKTYTFSFNPNSKVKINDGKGNTYSGTNRYTFTVWLNKEIGSQWPVIRDEDVRIENSPLFSGWTENSNDWRALIQVSDGGYIRRANNAGGVLRFTPIISSSLTTTMGMIHYVWRDEDGNDHEMLEYRETKPVTASNVKDASCGTKYSGYRVRELEGYSIISDQGISGSHSALGNHNVYIQNGQITDNWTTVVVKSSPETVRQAATVYKYVLPEGESLDQYYTSRTNSGVPQTRVDRIETSNNGTRLAQDTPDGYCLNPAAVFVYDASNNSATNIYHSSDGRTVDATYTKTTLRQHMVLVEKTTELTFTVNYDLYNYYKPNTYKLTFYKENESNTGFDTVASQDVVFKTDTSTIVSDQAEPDAPNDYTRFVGWALSPYQTDESMKYTGGNMPAQNVGLYPIWKTIAYTVTVKNDQEEIQRIIPNVKVGTLLGELYLSDPTQDDAVFLGWQMKDSAHEGQFVNLTDNYEITSDITIYPRWKKIKPHKVMYYKNDGTENEEPFRTDDQEYAVGAQAVILAGVDNGTALSITRKDLKGNDYTANFAYWTTNPDGTGDIYYPDDLYIFMEDNSADLKLYAQYATRREVRLMYRLNGGESFVSLESGKSVSTTNETIGSAGETVVPVFFSFDETTKKGYPNSAVRASRDQSETPVEFRAKRVGYHQTGWDTETEHTADSTAVGLNAWVRVDTIGADDKGRVFLYAQWEGDTLPIDVYKEGVAFRTGESYQPTAVTSTAWNTATLQSTADGLYTGADDYTYADGAITVTEDEEEKSFRFVRATVVTADAEPTETEEITEIKYDNNATETGYVWQYKVKNATTFTDLPEGATIRIYYDVAATTLTVTKTWTDNSVASGADQSNGNSGITLTFKKGDGTALTYADFNGIHQTDGNVTVSTTDGTVTLNKANADDGQGGTTQTWPESWTVLVPAESVSVTEHVPGYVDDVKANFTETATTIGNVNVAAHTINITNTRAIVKVTDASGNLLYKADGTPAVYTTATALEDAFTDINADGTIPFYTTAAHDTPYSGAYKVQMLVPEYSQTTGATLSTGKTVTLTTASESATDGFPYTGTSGTKATITRALTFTTASMIASSGTLTTTNITLDGNNVPLASDINGGAINASGTLTVGDGTILRNGRATNGGAVYASGGYLNVGDADFFDNRATGNGGAIYLASGVTAGEHSMAINGHTTGGLSSETKNAVDGGGVYVSSGASFTFTGGELSNCSASGNGGGMYSLGTLTMTEDTTLVGSADAKRGSFANCSATNGGGIYIAGGNMTMTGGAIENCAATGNGGGIYVAGGKMDMSSDDAHPGLISGCSATNGGGIYVNAGVLEMTGGTMRGCSATGNGGGVYNKATFKIEHTGTYEAAIIEDCYAGENGGAIYEDNANSVLTLTDITIQGHTTGKTTSLNASTANAVDGGAIYVNAGGLTLGDSRIYDCTASGNGGAIYDDSELRLTISGTTINGHKDLAATTKNATGNGGGIFMPNHAITEQKIAQLTITNCNFYNLTAGGDGGALYNNAAGRNSSLDAATVMISGTTIDGHYGGFSASEMNAQNGGGIFMQTGWLTVTGGEIKNCTVTEDGGAIYSMPPSTSHANNRTVYLTRVNVSGDTAGGNGGGVFVKMGKLTVDNCTMTDLTAGHGAALYAGINDDNTVAAEILVKDSTIRLCHATAGTAANEPVGGAINIKLGTGDIPTIVFEGDTVVKDNVNDNEDKEHQHNMVLEINNSGVIKTSTAGIGTGANIGVYVTGSNPHQAAGQTDPYLSHGNPGQPFGTHGDGTANSGTVHLALEAQENADKKAFINDRDNTMYGVLGEGDYASNIVWHRDTDILTITKTWVGDSATDRPDQIVINVLGKTGTTLALNPNLQTDSNVAFATDNTRRVILKKNSSGQWPESWTVVVPSYAAGVTEEIVPGYAQNVVFYEDINEDMFANITNTRATVKITDANGNLLYRADGTPAVYAGTTALEDAFAAINNDATAPLYDSSNAATRHEVTGAYKVQLLVSKYTQTAGATLAQGKTVTLTTASSTDTDGFAGPYTGDAATKATIERGASYAGDLVTNNGTLTLTNVALDGNTAAATGALVANNGTLTLTDGAALTGNKSDAGAVTNGTGATVKLSGSAKVTGNTDASGNNAKNIVLDQDSNTVIHVTGALSNDIGIYVTDSRNDAHGLSGKPFATDDVNGGSSAESLAHLVNDRKTKGATGSTTPLTGAAGVTTGTIMWEVGKLTVTKTVGGAMGDPTKDFTFTLTAPAPYANDTFKTKKGETEGENTSTARSFTLKHGESIELYLPYGAEFTIAETVETGYTTWMLERGTAIADTDKTDANKKVSINVTLTAASTLQVLNWLDAVSPTGVTIAYAPYVLMLLAGIILLALRKRRKAE